MLYNETAPTCHVFALKFLQTTTPAIRYWSHLVQHVSGFAGLLTMRTWVVTAPSDTPITKAKGSADSCRYPENAKSMFTPMCQAFKMQPKLHNSVDWGISKFVYLCLHLVVCFYPGPPAWPWLWGHTYRHLVCVKWYCFFNGHFEICSDPSNSIVADPSIKALKTSFNPGCTIYLQVRSWSSSLAQATKIVGIIV